MGKARDQASVSDLGLFVHVHELPFHFGAAVSVLIAMPLVCQCILLLVLDFFVTVKMVLPLKKN